MQLPLHLQQQGIAQHLPFAMAAGHGELEAIQGAGEAPRHRALIAAKGLGRELAVALPQHRIQRRQLIERDHRRGQGPREGPACRQQGP